MSSFIIKIDMKLKDVSVKIFFVFKSTIFITVDSLLTLLFYPSAHNEHLLKAFCVHESETFSLNIVVCSERKLVLPRGFSIKINFPRSALSHLHRYHNDNGIGSFSFSFTWMEILGGSWVGFVCCMLPLREMILTCRLHLQDIFFPCEFESFPDVIICKDRKIS